MRSVTVVIPGRPPGANELIRMGHWRIRKVRAEWKDKAHWLTLQARGQVAFERGRIAVEWRCRTARRRDLDNSISGLKPILDGIVSSGLLPDDSSDVIVELGPLTIVTGAPEDQTVVTVTEV